MNYLTSLNDRWLRFWFSATRLERLDGVRYWIALLSAITFIGYMLDGPGLYGESGIVNARAGRFLIGVEATGTGANYRWSPLYENPGLVIPVSILGMIGSSLLLWRKMSWLGAMMAFVALAMFHHRGPLLISRYEPLLSAGLVYLSLLWNRRWVSISSAVLRLLQIHWIVWLGASLSNMISFEGWWSGASIQQLILDGQGYLGAQWGTEEFSQFLMTVFVGLQVGLIVCLIRPGMQYLGMLFLGGLMMAILLVTSDWLYLLTYMAYATSFWGVPKIIESRIRAIDSNEKEMK